MMKELERVGEDVSKSLKWNNIDVHFGESVVSLANMKTFVSTLATKCLPSPPSMARHNMAS